jgi:hypothetical protein
VVVENEVLTPLDGFNCECSNKLANAKPSIQSPKPAEPQCAAALLLALIAVALSMETYKQHLSRKRREICLRAPDSPAGRWVELQVFDQQRVGTTETAEAVSAGTGEAIQKYPTSASYGCRGDRRFNLSAARAA